MGCSEVYCCCKSNLGFNLVKVNLGKLGLKLNARLGVIETRDVPKNYNSSIPHAQNVTNCFVISLNQLLIFILQC